MNPDIWCSEECLVQGKLWESVSHDVDGDSRGHGDGDDDGGDDDDDDDGDSGHGDGDEDHDDDGDHDDNDDGGDDNDENGGHDHTSFLQTLCLPFQVHCFFALGSSQSLNLLLYHHILPEFFKVSGT